MSNLIIYVSSRNNYDMFQGEILDNFETNGFEIINVDDDSIPAEQEKGKKYCEEAGVVYLQNKSRGVQMATQTVMDYINENRPNCKFVLCFQHDVKPLDLDLFNQLSRRIDEGEFDGVGAFGFNVLDNGKYTKDMRRQWNMLESPKGMLGLCHLGVKDNRMRWISPGHNKVAVKNPEKFDRPFLVEFPAWMAVGISVKLWNEFISPTDQYHFHLWFPSVAMAFNYNNIPVVTIPDLYCLNQQELKEKYSIPTNSAHGSKNGDTHHFGEYQLSHDTWLSQWGWEYENVGGTFPTVAHNYSGTMIERFYNHDINEGPICYLEDWEEYLNG